MGEKRDPDPLPSLLSSPPAVCCMCGDLGLSEELFRCKTCIVRLQHRYCSNLYPKLQIYILCNWCLRERGDDRSPAADLIGSNTTCTELQKEYAPPAKLKLPPLPPRLKILKRDGMRKTGTAAVTRSRKVVRRLEKSAKEEEGLRSRIRKFKLLEEVCR